GNVKAVARITSMPNDQIIMYVEELRKKAKEEKKSKQQDSSVSPIVSRIVRLLTDNPQIQKETLDVLQIRLRHLSHQQPQKVETQEMAFR
ncbi:MAG: hypothetical protein FWD47_15350, partial [Treponema sp.]|nr:hypothetical protein [Treponema sp.]